MRTALVQLNFTVGDFAGNTQKIRSAYSRAVGMGAELVVLTELAIFGYPPKDMLLHDEYVERQYEALELIKRDVGEVGLILGFAERNPSAGRGLFNAALLVHKHKVMARKHKELLPNYDVFDELRYFEPGSSAEIFEYRGKRVAIEVCEDIWGGTENPYRQRLYAHDPLTHLEGRDIDLLVIVNGSPYFLGKGRVRLDLVGSIARRLNCAVAYVNQVGGNDDLVFDGRSFGVNKEGVCTAICRAFEEDIMLFYPGFSLSMDHPDDTASMADLEEGLVLSLDYVKKTGHTDVVIGLSGGIDSALTAAIAVKRFGPDHVHGISMPSDFSSEGSILDAQALAKNLGISFDVVPIKQTYLSYGNCLQPVIGWEMPGSRAGDVTEENIQARIRGNILMAYTNRHPECLVLSTGNKSEISVGYCTLYGDMAGGYALLSDIPKTMVYELARYINREREIIPEASITKPPSAELRPGQTDQQSLPPYEVLDAIIHSYVEERSTIQKIVERGFEDAVVRWVVKAIQGNEYKRQQMASGPKLTTTAFGSGWRYPVAAKF